MYDGERYDEKPDIPAARQTVRGETRAEMIERMRCRIRSRLDAGSQRPVRCGCGCR
jgi:hypothetical protein